MHRNSLISLLHNYHPTDSHEIKSKERILTFIKAHNDCFERSLQLGHITASAWLLNKDQSKALLTHHAKLNMWLQLGGHCDGNPNVLEVAIKEAQEESGINNIVPVSHEIFDIDVHRFPATSKEQAHDHYDVRFLLRVASDEQFIQNHESKELRWISKNRAELPAQDPSVIRMFDKWTQKEREIYALFN